MIPEDYTIDGLTISEMAEILRPHTPDFVGKSDVEIKDWWTSRKRQADKAYEIIRPHAEQKRQSANCSP
jgi:hypothetical protein